MRHPKGRLTKPALFDSVRVDESKLPGSRLLRVVAVRMVLPDQVVFLGDTGIGIVVDVSANAIRVPPRETLALGMSREPGLEVASLANVEDVVTDSAKIVLVTASHGIHRGNPLECLINRMNVKIVLLSG